MSTRDQNKIIGDSKTHHRYRFKVVNGEVKSGMNSVKQHFLVQYIILIGGLRHNLMLRYIFLQIANHS